MGNDRIGVLLLLLLLLYAGNDVVVRSESADELQSLLDVVDGYVKDFGVS